MASRKPYRYYRAFGCVIKSAYVLPYAEIEPCDPADVLIRDGPVPAQLEDCAVSHGIWQTAPMTFLLIEETVGRILVRDGKEVIVQRASAADPRWVGVYINGSALAALLQQRGLLPLHASAVRTPSGAVLFAGASGTGKSTLAATMQERGFPPLSDDVAAIRLDGRNVPVVESAYAHLRLWQDVVDTLSYSTVDKALAAEKFQKFEFPVKQFGFEASPVRKIYFLQPKVDEVIRIQPTDRGNAFRLVSLRSYRSKFHLGQGLQRQHFQLASMVSATVPVATVSRPLDGREPRLLADAIIKDLAEDTVVQVHIGGA